jgi:phage/plasmid-like protein (TIGR03299 family)
MANVNIYERTGKEVSGDTWQDVCKDSPLNWGNEFSPSVQEIPVRNPLTGEKTKFKGLYRTDTEHCLSIVGEGYNVTQPEQMFSFMDSFVGMEGLKYSRAGYIGQGEKVFVQAQIGKFDLLASGDVSEKYVTVMNSFDGSISLMFLIAMIRIVCQNTFQMAANTKTDAKMKYKNTASKDAKVAADLRLFQTLKDTGKSIEEKMEVLAQRKVTSEMIGKTISEIFKVESNKELSSEKARQILTVKELFESNDGNAFPQFRGTAYNLFNAITEYADHHRDTRTTNGTTAERQRAFTSIFGSGNDMKQQGIDLVLELTKGAESVNQTVAYSFADTGLNIR